MRTTLAGLALATALVAAGCGDDSSSAPPAAADTPPLGDSASHAGGDVPTDSASTDTETPTGLVDCRSFFAVRALELARAADPSIALSCEIALPTDVRRPGSDAVICQSGESANACQARLYASPPNPVTALAKGCRTGAVAGPGCLAGVWLPACADGTNTSCAQPEAICQDGTRPMAYMEPGEGAGSTTWIIQMGGEGQPCAGRKCWFNYRFAHTVGKTEYERAMSTLHPDYATNGARRGSGITSGGQAAPAQIFGDSNRIYINRCADSVSDSTEQVPLYDEDLTDFGTAPIYHRGMSIWRSLFHSLATSAGRDLDSDGQADMPSLADATRVLLVGDSDASVWLSMAADDLAAALHDIAGPQVDVRVVIDGFYNPGLDNQGRYVSGAPADFDLFSHPYSAETGCALPDNDDPTCSQACSDLNYRPGPDPDGAATVYDALSARGTILDSSCVAMHGPDAPQCYDRIHVMLNHVSTPLFVVADQEDRVVRPSPVEAAEQLCYRWPTLETYRRALLDQSFDIRDYWNSARREEPPTGLEEPMLVLRKVRRDGEPPEASIHTSLGDNGRTMGKMTRCDASGAALGTASVAAMINLWMQGTAPAHFIMEDAATWDGASNYWVTGTDCSDHE